MCSEQFNHTSSKLYYLSPRDNTKKVIITLKYQQYPERSLLWSSFFTRVVKLMKTDHS